MAGIFLKFEGGPKITGGGTMKGFEKQVVADSFSIGASNAINPSGSATERVRSMVQVSSFSISKNMTNASPTLFQAVAGGVEFPKITVSMVIQDAKAPQWHTEFVFENVYCDSISWNGGGDGAMFESCSFVFSKIKVSHKEFVDGKPVGPTSATWDLKKNTP